jgi:hypothetical protein
MTWGAVGLVVPSVACSVKVVLAVVVLTNVPEIVAEVNGVVRLCGESVPSVFVMFALVGVPT